MPHLRTVFYFWLMPFLFIACAKKDVSQSSKLVMKMPEATMQKSGLIQGFSASGCFAVNITGEGINNSSPSRCDGQFGLFAGLVPAGGTIELQTSFGKNRTIDLFYVVSEQGCTSININQGLAQVFGSNKVHRISRTQGVNFDQPEVVVEVQIDWPDRANSLAQLLSLPETCLRGEDPLDPMAMKQARLVQGSAHGVTQDGSQVHIRILDQRLNMTNPNNWSGRLQPVRLGEEQ